MKRTQQRIRGQTIDKTTAKSVGVVKTQEKHIICNKAVPMRATFTVKFYAP